MHVVHTFSFQDLGRKDAKRKVTFGVANSYIELCSTDKLSSLLSETINHPFPGNDEYFGKDWGQKGLLDVQYRFRDSFSL
jgi:hypothetical protein